MGRLRDRFGESLVALRGVFGNAALRRIEFAYAGSQIGNFANGVAVAVYAYEQGGATAVGIVTAIRQIVAATIAPFSASLADKLPRERVMLAADLGRVLTVGATAAAVARGSAPLLVYALATATTALATLFRPAEASLMPLIARTPEELTAANITSSTFDSLGVFVGPSIAAFLLALRGPEAAFAFVALTFVWSAFFIARVHTPPMATAHGHGGGDDASRSLVDGFRAIGAEPRLRLLIGLYGAQCFVAGALGVFVVAVALRLLGIGSAGVGLLQAACGVGALAGAGVALSLVPRARLATDFALGLFLWGVPLLLLGAFPTAVVAAIALTVVGVGNTLVDISAMTLLQRAAPPDVAGRIFGCLESVVIGSLALGALSAPVLIALVGIRGGLIVVGSVLPILGVLRWRALARIDDGSRVPVERLEAVRAVPFLAALPLQTLEFLAARLELVELSEPQTLFSSGDHGDRFYIIATGALAVELPGETKILHAPSFVGEIALLKDIPRTATVRSTTPVTLWALDRDDFLGAVTRHARSSAGADEVVTLRLGGAAA